MKIWETEKERTEQLPFALFLHSIPGIGNAGIEFLLQEYGSCEGIYHAKQEELVCLLGEKRAMSFAVQKGKCDVWSMPEKLWNMGITFKCRLDADYPMKLREIPDAPFALYGKGRFPFSEEKSVAIVGARKCTQYGAYMAAELGKSLALAGIPVISGMARGIDGISQQAVTMAGGTTYAVLGCGVNICYPQSNRALYQKIQEVGGVLSEYSPGTAPRAELFPPRNRIISGLADVVVVVEAGQKSGTLITVDMALEQGREIYCVPGRVTDRLSEGCNRLVGQGAGIILSVEDFLEKLLYEGEAGRIGSGCIKSEGNNKRKSSEGAMTKEEKALLELLDFDPVSVEQIYIQLAAKKGLEGLSLQDVMEGLMGLVLKELVVNVSGSYYAKKR